MILALLLSCSDYGIKPKPEDTDVSMGLALNPQSLAGEGWTLAPVELPLSIPGGDHYDLQLSGTAGEATLQIETSLPQRPLIEVPLSATPDGPPTVSILAPIDGEVLASGTTLALSASVGDDVDGAERLALAWESDVDGLISSAPAAADGDASAR